MRAPPPDPADRAEPPGASPALRPGTRSSLSSARADAPGGRGIRVGLALAVRDHDGPGDLGFLVLADVEEEAEHRRPNHAVRHIGDTQREEERVVIEHAKHEDKQDRREAQEAAQRAQPRPRNGGVAHVATHRDREPDHQELHQQMAWQYAEQVLIQLGGREGVERRQGHARGGGGEADEGALRRARLRDVEAGQPDRRRHHIEVAEDPLGPPAARELQLIDEESGGDSEAHHVHQAVELRAEPRAGLGEPGDPAVQRVEDAGEKDVPAGPVELAARREHDGPDAEEQVEQREQARHHDHDAPHRRGEGPHDGYSASTLAPARTRSPTATRSTGRPAAARNTSTREPKRIMPMRSPCVARAPTAPSVTIRRATSPAICRTSSGPRAARTPTDACSLSRLALSEAAWRKRPGW